MHEIKFRGRWLKKWYYGDMMRDERVPAMPYIGSQNNFVMVEPATVGQFTGLKDYDGKEIWEGDILRDTEGRIFQVVWNTGAGAWEFVGSKLHMLFIMTYPDLYKVIGNVHDNPGLLEQKP